LYFVLVTRKLSGVFVRFSCAASNDHVEDSFVSG
jgi:hypothetical protein